MIDTIVQWDQDLFLTLNRLRHPSLDGAMDWISHSMIPGFVILFLTAFFGYKSFHKKVWLLIFFSLVSVGVTDSVSSRIFKPGFERFRPCHEPELAGKWQTVGNCWGGKYGFVSSHAANTFGVAFFLWLVFRNRYKWFSLLIPYAALVSYTRIYLAKHYPLDLVGGAALGAFSAFILFFIWSRLVLKQAPFQDPR